MNDDIDKKFDKLAKKRKQDIREKDRDAEVIAKPRKEKHKKEVEKFKEVYSDLKKICEKFGKSGENDNYAGQGETLRWLDFLSHGSLTHIRDIILYDNYLEIETNKEDGFGRANIEHVFGVNIEKNCFNYTSDIYWFNNVHVVETSSKGKEILFDSKEKLIEFIMKKIIEYLTDEEVTKYFKK